MNLVNVSEGASLAMHSLALIASAEHERMTVKQIAQQLHASQAHLAKVFQKLSRAGIVDSVRGPSGGVMLSRNPENVSLLDIYEIIDGKVSMGKCPLNKTYCSFENCIFSDDLNRIASDTYNTLKKITLSDFYQKNR